MKRSATLLATTLLAACGAERSPSTLEPRVDAGQLQSDAGLGEDAGSIDAQTPDAGQPSPDAGQPSPDAGEPAPDAGPSASVTFTEHVWPVFESVGCGRAECHGTLVTGGGPRLLLSTPEIALRDLKRRAQSGRLYVAVGDPQSSELFIHGRDANIPAGDLTQEGLDVMAAWILEGAAPGPDIAPPAPAPEPDTCDIVGSRGLAPLPAACMPRCSSETFNALSSCSNAPDPAECRAAAVAADASPIGTLQVGPEVAELDCRLCLDWQAFSCAFERCPTETMDLVRCPSIEASTDGCAAVQAAFQECFQLSGAATCQRTRSEACF